MIMADKNGYIAVFDSGVGGISVLRRLRQQLPAERFLYFGDSANAPYGQRSPEKIRELTFAAVERILTRPVKALVVACNTATAVAVDALRARYPQLLIIGIEPAVKLAADRYPGGTVCMLSTPATLQSQRVIRLMEAHSDRCTFIPLGTPELAPLVERGEGNGPRAGQLMEELFAPYKHRLDAVVLGCTHYPYAARALRDCLGPSVALLDGGPGTAVHTAKLLEKAGLLSDGPGELLWENSLDTQEILERCAMLMEQPLEEEDHGQRI